MVTGISSLEKPTQHVSPNESTPGDGPRLSNERVWAALASVHDPEIPPCSIVDLGIVERVAVSDGLIEVDLLPTFAGCPALDIIEEDVKAALHPVSEGRTVHVRFVYSPPWTSDRITSEGREALRGYGVTLPFSVAVSPGKTFVPLSAIDKQPPAQTCPFCGSRETVLESAFGPTLCRSIHFCRACRNPFEGFKPKTAVPRGQP